MSDSPLKHPWSSEGMWHAPQWPGAIGPAVSLALMFLCGFRAEAQTFVTRQYSFNNLINVSCCSGFNYGFTSLIQDTSLSGSAQVVSIKAQATGSIRTP